MPIKYIARGMLRVNLNKSTSEKFKMFWLPLVSATVPLVFPTSQISGPYDSIEGCREWFRKIVQLNPEHCRLLNNPYVNSGGYSKQAVPHKTYDEAGMKITDGRYRCDFERPWTGCSTELVTAFSRMDFYMLCEDIDGVEARLVILHNYPQNPQRAYMYCTEQDHHKQLVRERLIVLHQAKKEITRHVGPDAYSCIDSFL